MSDQHKVMYHELLTCVYLSGTQLAQQLHLADAEAEVSWPVARLPKYSRAPQPA
jgi:hypothetical protein